MTNLTYIPLHHRSCYSINDGLQNIKPIVKQAAKLGFPALAVTDLNNLCGFVRFYNACLEEGIKPIMGADLQVNELPQPGQGSKKFLLTVLAMDLEGKNNLYELLSKAWLDTNSPDLEEAACSLEDLKRYNQGLIILDGFRGDLPALFADPTRLEHRLAFYKQYFADRFCLEITRTGRIGEAEFEQQALELCAKHQIAPVATNDGRFLFGPDNIGEDGFSDYYIHDVRVSIQRNIPRGSEELATLYSPQQFMLSQEQMQQRFADLPEALENTLAIAQRCNIVDERVFELDKPRLPHYDTGQMSAAQKLIQLSEEGLEKRLKFLFPDEQERLQKRAVYDERLKTELKVIIEMDFPGYFLIVQDFINWSKEHGVPVGPGRGSGGGSLVAYALRITDFDPLRFNLLFERFLNPERISMPDFDIDFCQRTRVKTLDYVKEHYDEISLRDYQAISVSQIAAFGTLAAKAALKGVGKALGMPYTQVDRITKLLPKAPPDLTFAAALGEKKDKDGNPLPPEAPDFASRYQRAKAANERELIDLIHISKRLEGVIRSIGKHAAGVVISPTKLTEFSPLMLDADGKPITQYDKKDVEHAGLVKFDFLGLTTLTIIEDAMVMIREKLRREGKPTFEVEDIPYEDEDCFKMLQEGQSTAVFQLESTGMRQLISKLRPDRFEDLVALVALYRPGPLESGMVDQFVKRKHGTEKVAYPQPEFEEKDLEPILESTYGVIVYQEQVMQIAQVLAGYSLGGADILRRAMGKKMPEEMAKQRKIFEEGAIKTGHDPKKDMQIFDLVENFAKYGFNKSHSAAYALVAWWTLWLKVHYPAQFLAAMMTADAMKTEKLISYIDECQRLGIKVNPPDVNVGEFSFGVNTQGEVVYGFSAIKGIGEYLVKQIKSERELHGAFSDFYDFVKRVSIADGKRLLQKDSLESLIKSGALDCINPNRAQLVANIENALNFAQKKTESEQVGQLDLFDSLGIANSAPQLKSQQAWTDKQRLFYEKNLLGLYLSGHPILPYLQELRDYTHGVTLKNMQPGTTQKPNNLRIGGVVTNISIKISKKDNAKGYIITLDDSSTSLELALFSRNAQKFEEIYNAHQLHDEQLATASSDPEGFIPSNLILLLDVKVSYGEENQVRVFVRNIYTLEQLRMQEAHTICLSLTFNKFERHLAQIQGILSRNRKSNQQLEHEQLMAAQSEESPAINQGCNLKLVLDKTAFEFSQQQYRYLPSDDLIDSIRELLGEHCLQVI